LLERKKFFAFVQKINHLLCVKVTALLLRATVYMVLVV